MAKRKKKKAAPKGDMPPKNPVISVEGKSKFLSREMKYTLFFVFWVIGAIAIVVLSWQP